MDPHSQSFQKKQSFVSFLCKCIPFKSKQLINSVHHNTQKWKGFTNRSELQSLSQIFMLLIDLYDGKDVYDGLEACKINPTYSSNQGIRNDLEYYIPQFTNSMIFHHDFVNEKLNEFLYSLSQTDPYFAHLFYWYINSLSLSIDDSKGQNAIGRIMNLCSREPQAQLFIRDYESFYAGLEKRLDKEEYQEKIKDIQIRQAKLIQFLDQYKSANFNNFIPIDFTLQGSDLEMKPYVSPFYEGNEAYSSNPFNSTILFFEDLYLIAQAMTKADNKLKFLKRRLRKLNKALPSSVYIPFVKDSVRCYSILDVVVEETRVFSTKERSPFYICLEIFNPQKELEIEFNTLFPQIQEEMKNSKGPKKNLVSIVKKAFKKRKNNRYIKMSGDFTNEQPNNEIQIRDLEKITSSPNTLKEAHHMHKVSFTARELERNFARSESCPYNLAENKDTLGDDPAGDNHLEKLQLSPKFGTAQTAIEIRDPSKSANISPRNNNQSIEFVPNGINNHDFPPIGSPVSCKISPFGATNNLTNFLKNDSNEDKDSPDLKQDPKQVRLGDEFANYQTEIQSPYITKEKDIFFGEDSRIQYSRIRKESPFKDLQTWSLLPLIVKTGADMKEEQFAVQLISQFDQIFKQEKLKLLLTPYEIVSLGCDIGLVEVIKDSITFSSLKDKMYSEGIPSLDKFFEIYYGKDVEKARKKFCRSLAAYSLICYFLQIKDRHNGNIFLHKQGNLIHIDFGFFLSNAPGRGLEFEKKVHFKLLNEYIELLGGYRSGLFQEFRKLFYKGFMAARKHREQILILVKMMYSSQGANLPCFRAGLRSITELEQRFCPPDVAEKDLMGYCYNMINQSVDNWRAKCYDKFQYYVQGINY